MSPVRLLARSGGNKEPIEGFNRGMLKWILVEEV